MRYGICALILCIIFWRPVGAQTALRVPVAFYCENCSPADALVQLSRQTGINIVFNNRLFQQCSPLTINSENKTLQEVIEQISACASVEYKWQDEQLVFFKKTNRFTFSGFIQDAGSNERLIGASVRVKGKEMGVSSNEFGFFSLSLPEGTYDLLINYIGYRQETIKLDLSNNRRTIVWMKTDAALPEVVINAVQSSGLRPGTGTGGKQLSIDALKELPGPGGEPDLLRLAAQQPGVQSGVDGLGGLHVRGGNSDQNLILIDDVPVYNPTHALGLFSIFNPATVSYMKLWKGDFPARYGSRASSVIDIRTRDGNQQQWKGEHSVGLFATSHLIEGPVFRNKGAVLAAMRTTYFGPWIRLFSNNDAFITFSGKGAAYRFYDLNIKANYTFSEKSRLYLSFYEGNDLFRNNFTQTFTVFDGIVNEKYQLKSDWGNSIVSLRWNRIIGNKLFLNATLRASRFYYRSQLRLVSTQFDFTGKSRTVDDYALIYNTLIKDWSGKFDFSYYPNQKWILRWGLAHTLHTFRPGALSVNFRLAGQPATSIDSLTNQLRNNEKLVADETEAYIDAEWHVLPSVTIQAGLNGINFQLRNQSFPSIQPRLRVEHTGRRGWRQWAGIYRMVQNLHQIGTFNISLPFELWVPSTDKVPPELVWQTSAGFGWERGGWAVELEGYYKRLNRVLAFLSFTDALFIGGAEDASGWEDRIVAGVGRSKGLEFSLEKKLGSTSGRVGYTLSETTRQFREINSGEPFPFRFDRRHDFKIEISQRLASWLQLNLAWNFATGNPVTLASVRYLHQTPDAEPKREVYVYTEVNGYRLPNFHRLDAALTAGFEKGPFRHSIQLGAYNAYNRANPFYLYLIPSSNVRGRAVQYTLLPLIPILRYQLNWSTSQLQRTGK